MNKNGVMIIIVTFLICLYISRPQIFTKLISDSEAEFNESYSEQSVLSKKEQMYQYLKEHLEPYFDK